MLVDVIIRIMTKQRHNPFGQYRVVDYFLHKEFQHRDSPHAHIILWLDNDPREDVIEDMPRTIRMMTDLCSVDRRDIKDNEIYGRQVYRHTFTCKKRGEKRCRFNIPYWPKPISMVLCPLAKDDRRRREGQRNCAIY
jgi:hypothetical protein